MILHPAFGLRHIRAFFDTVAGGCLSGVAHRHEISQPLPNRAITKVGRLRAIPQCFVAKSAVSFLARGVAADDLGRGDLFAGPNAVRHLSGACRLTRRLARPTGPGPDLLMRLCRDPAAAHHPGHSGPPG